MKILLYITVVVSTLQSILVSAADVAPLNQSHWVVEYRNPALKSDFISIMVHNTESNLKAVVNLQRSYAEEGLYQGSFSVRFASTITKSNAIDFYLGRDKLFVKKFNLEGDILNFELSGDLSSVVNKNKPNEIPEDKMEQKINPKVPVTAPEIKPVVQAPTINDLKKIEEDRAKIEQKEAELQAARLAKAAQMSEADKKIKKQKAAELAKEGMDAYKAGKFKEAAGLFNSASEQDPENFDFVYQHAICRYKIGQYNRSLSLLSLSDGADINQTERAYYIALNHLKLQEYNLALKQFKEIKEEKDPTFSPLASFFAGHIEFRNQKYPAARKDFEDVIDQSKDPQLDKDSEAMLEQIDKIEAFIAASKERFKYTLYIGPSYDSNVVNMSSSLLPTDTAAWRANYGGSLTYHLLRKPKYSVDGEFTLNDYYSLDKTFKVDSTLQSADSLEIAAGVPVHIGYLNISPSYKLLYLSPSTGGARKLAISSAILGVDYSNSWMQTWSTKYYGQLSSDVSSLEITSSDDNQSGLKTTVGCAVTKFFDLKGETSLTADFSYLMAQPSGKNYQSTKPALGLTYGYIGFWAQSASVRLDYSSQNYSAATTPRTDVVSALTWTQNKKLSNNWSLALGANVTSSQSGVSTYQYSKYAVSSLFTYSGSVLK